MTREELVKALRFCSHENCLDCPLLMCNGVSCIDRMLRAAADMLEQDALESQKAESKHYPTVDAVEVVRCKDCIHRDDGSCPMDENYPWHDTKSDDFCSYRERKG